METLKFKVGDKVRVKSLEWYNKNKNFEGNVYPEEKTGIFFSEFMSNMCGKIVQIEKFNGDYTYYVNGSSLFWQDWMLEDEVVTEETQEVQQLNKNDMETKEMTKEEAFLYLNNTKIICTSNEETTKVQVKLFELGVEWMLLGKNVSADKYLLFINERQKLQHCSDIDYWIKDINRRIEPSEILAIKLKEKEGPRFDPKSLKPFDKVLVRDKECDRWRCNLFCHINEELKCKYFCVFDNWIYCIPYNEETKHLHRTAEDAPEFYRI